MKNNVFRPFRLLILTASLVAATVSTAALAEETEIERSYPLPGHGVLIMKVPAAWHELVAQPNAAIPPTIKLTPASDTSFTYILTPLWPVPGMPENFGTPDHLRTLVGDYAKQVAGSTIEKKIDLKELTGTNTIYYFNATHKDTKSGANKYMTQGAVRVGTLVVTFTLLTKEKDPALARQAMALLQTASQAAKLAVDKGLTLTKDGKYEIHATTAPWVVRFKHTGLALRQERRMDDGKTRYYHFTAADSPLNVSLFIERVTECKTSNACRALQLSGENMKAAVDVKEYDQGEFSILEYKLKEFQGETVNQSNVNAHFVKDGYWLDLRLSQSGPTAENRALFADFLKGVEVRRINK